MKKIYKFEITPEITGMDFTTPILRVEMQHGKPMLWAEVSTEVPTVVRKFEVIPTGGEVKPYRQYLGTLFDDPYVLHVYELTNYGDQAW